MGIDTASGKWNDERKYSQDKYIINRTLEGMGKQLDKLKNKEEDSQLSDIRNEITALQQAISSDQADNNKDTIISLWDEFKLRKEEEATKFLRKIEDEGQYKQQDKLCIMAVQTLLRKKGYFDEYEEEEVTAKDRVDGMNGDSQGNKTKDALKKFQDQYNSKLVRYNTDTYGIGEQGEQLINKDGEISFETIKALLNEKNLDQQLDEIQKDKDAKVAKDIINDYNQKTITELFTKDQSPIFDLQKSIKDEKDKLKDPSDFPEELDKKLKIINILKNPNKDIDISQIDTTQTNRENTVERGTITIDKINAIKETYKNLKGVDYNGDANDNKYQEFKNGITIRETIISKYEEYWNNEIAKIKASPAVSYIKDIMAAGNPNNYINYKPTNSKENAYFTDEKKAQLYINDFQQNPKQFIKNSITNDKFPKIKKDGNRIKGETFRDDNTMTNLLSDIPQFNNIFNAILGREDLNNHATINNIIYRTAEASTEPQ